MCGRFTIISDPVAYQMEFDIQMDDSVKSAWKPRYNVTPSQPIPVVTTAADRAVSLMQWGLIPAWSGSPAKFNLINVRAETINEKAYFKRLVQQDKRCLILSSGFYEWQKSTQKSVPKTPYYFSLRENKPFAFAGVWESVRGADEQPAATCAIITCMPNELVRPVHERMPVMLDGESGQAWLGEHPLDQLLSLLAPFPAERMTAHPVGLTVNSPQADGAQCIQPAGQ